VVAAKADTLINAVFNAELRFLVETFEAAEGSGNQNFRGSCPLKWFCCPMPDL
jgi:hypothetical protein